MAANLHSVNNLITTALRLGGVSREGEIPAEGKTATALMFLNATLAQWSQYKAFIYFVKELTFIGITNQLYYFIGQQPGDTIQASPFLEIDSVVYNIGGVTYTPQRLSKVDFDNIAFKQASSMPGNWTYQVNENNCQFGLYPRTVGGEIITITGKQKLDDVNLFESAQASIVSYAFLPLSYWLAKDLSIYYNTTPTSGFDAQFAKYTKILINSNQKRTEFNNPIPFSTNSFGPYSMGAGFGY
ncbi:hypothetical protein [Nitrospira sp. BLG_2]|uniref:hypothetical protein n=1 Tax=Nitrospira sp. BLG_2 TaxID=3397507 RepID=UPI003B99059C